MHYLGDSIIAKAESAILGYVTVRHRKCDYLVYGNKEVKCTQCKSNQKSLHTILSRLIHKRNNHESIGCHTLSVNPTIGKENTEPPQMVPAGSEINQEAEEESQIAYAKQGDHYQGQGFEEDTAESFPE